MAGHAAGAEKDASLARAAPAAVAFPLFGIGALRSGRGPESDDAAPGGPFGALGIAGPPSKEGRPCDNAAGEPANEAPKAEFARRGQSGGLCGLQAKLDDHAWRYDSERMHSALGYMSPVESRRAGLSL